MSAERPLDRSAVQAVSSLDSDKVVANRDPESVRVCDLYNRAPIRTTLIFFAEVQLYPRQGNRTALCVQCEAHHRAVELLPVLARAGHYSHLEGVQNDAGSHGIHAHEVDERLDQHLILPAFRIFPHLTEHLVRLDWYRLIDPSGG